MVNTPGSVHRETSPPFRCVFHILVKILRINLYFRQAHNTIDRHRLFRTHTGFLIQIQTLPDPPLLWQGKSKSETQTTQALTGHSRVYCYDQVHPGVA